jgi:hypothetical protein
MAYLPFQRWHCHGAPDGVHVPPHVRLARRMKLGRETQ